VSCEGYNFTPFCIYNVILLYESFFDQNIEFYNHDTYYMISY